MVFRDGNEEGLLKIPSFFPVLELFIFFDLFLQCFGALTWCCGKCFEFF